MRLHYCLNRPISLDADLDLNGFTVLFGASGSGKTSLLRAVAGLLPACGEPWNDWPVQRRPIGYLPQGYALFPHLRVWENVAYALDGPRVLRRAQALRLLDSLNLVVLAERWPAEISGGQKQRVALARALARKPLLLLLDEPTSALDAATRDEVMAELIDGIRHSGIPALAASHDLHLAAMADRIALLSEGQIIQEGEPATVFSRPVNAAAARLLGLRNIYAARIVARNSTSVELDCEGLVLRADVSCRATVGQRVAVVIPVEAVSTSADGDGIAMTVCRLRREGISVRLWLRRDSITPTVEALLPLAISPPRPGDSLQVHIDPIHIHIIQTETSGGELCSAKLPSADAANKGCSPKADACPSHQRPRQLA